MVSWAWEVVSDGEAVVVVAMLILMVVAILMVSHGRRSCC